MTPTRCPRCSSRDTMQPVVSGRYETCTACPGAIGMWTYVPVADAPRHWMDGRSVRLPVQMTTIEEKPAAKRAAEKRRTTAPRRRARR